MRSFVNIETLILIRLKFQAGSRSDRASDAGHFMPLLFTSLPGGCMQWEYRKIYLGAVPSRTEDIDLLNDVGADGWELVAIMDNNVAYLKRLRGAPKRKTRNVSG
jgi:hypothetical protein